MGAPDFRLGQYDDQVPWDVTFRDVAGAVVDITGAAIAVRYQAADGSAPAQVRAAAIVNGAAGIARYMVQGVDTLNPGEFLGNFIATKPDGSVVTWPPERHLAFRVRPRPALSRSVHVPPPPRRPVAVGWWQERSGTRRAGGVY